MHICTDVCMRVHMSVFWPSGCPRGAGSAWVIRAGRPTSVCVCCVRGSLPASSSGRPPAQTGGCALPPTTSIRRAPRVLLFPAAPNARGCGTPRQRSGSAPPLLVPLLAADFGGQGAPTSTPGPSSQPPPPQPQRAEHRLGPRGLAAPSAPPSAPAGYGRSQPGAAAAASTATGSLPASGQRRPPALLSMSRHRPRPGLRLGTARAGAAVQAPAPAGSGHSSPGGFASAPRSRSPSV